jgi:uncharacterized protein YdcH (DUF465 family)
VRGPASRHRVACESWSQLLSFYLSIDLSIYLSIYRSIYQSIYLSQEMKRCVAEQAAKVAELDDLIDRNETESKQCDDKRALELRQEKKTLRGGRDEARAALEAPP